MAKELPPTRAEGRGRSSTAKQGGKQYAHMQEQWADLVQIFHQAFFTTADADRALVAAREAAVGGFASSEATNLVRKVIGAFLDDIVPRGFANAETEGFRDSISKLAEVKRSLLANHFKDMLDILSAEGELRKRYTQDHPYENRTIAEYVARMFLAQGPPRCFVQASTAAIYLGQAIARAEIPPTSLFYTNSIVFPLAVLRPNAHYAVYTFCGSIYDPVCGGWLFPVGDSATADMLRNLYNRQDAPLKIAYLMPDAISPGGVYYQRAESALLCRILIEESSQIVILATPNRLREDKDRGDACYCAEAGQLAMREKPVSLVVAGRDDRRDDITDCFLSLGVTVHWGDVATGKWQQSHGVQRGRSSLETNTITCGAVSLPLRVPLAWEQETGGRILRVGSEVFRESEPDWRRSFIRLFLDLEKKAACNRLSGPEDSQWLRLCELVDIDAHNRKFLKLPRLVGQLKDNGSEPVAVHFAGLGEAVLTESARRDVEIIRPGEWFEADVIYAETHETHDVVVHFANISWPISLPEVTDDDVSNLFSGN
jgi:hypothetical protein